MIQPLLAGYVYSLGAAAVEVGFVTSAFAVTALLFKMISGPAIDAFKKERVLRFALVIMAIAFSGYSLSRSIKTVVVFRLLQGVGQAFTGAGYLALATDSLPPEKLGTGIGVFTLAQAASQAVSPAVGLKIAEHYSFNTTFFVGALMMLCSFCLSFQIKSREPAVKKPFRIAPENFIAREALLPGALMTLLMSCFCLINTHLVIFASQRDVKHIGYYFSVYACVLLITRPLLGRLSDRLGCVRVLIPALLCFASSFFIISFSHNLPMFLLAAVVAAFGFGASSPVINSLCMKSVTPDRRGAASSTSYIGFDLGNLCGPALAGLVIGRFGYPAMWRIMTALIFTAILLLMIFHRRIAWIESEFRRRSDTAPKN